MKRLPVDWFMGGMIAAVVLAWLFPAPGAAGGWLHPELLTKAGVALIFFLHGAGLSFDALKSGALRWRVHTVVQATTFLVFPLIGLAAYFGLEGRIGADLRIGLFFLCALPSTVSSSVAMTAAARGNVAVAVFNATLSSIIGVFLTPLWIGAVLKVSGQGLALGPVIFDLVRWLILPLVLGQVCRPWIGAWIKRHKSGVHLADRGTILLLVYTSFCDSFKNQFWSAHGVWTIALVILASGALFALVMIFTARISRAMGFPREDTIAAMFCGSKKTLASGVPMAKLIFGASPGLGMILLPIMIYHPLQLIACGLLVNAWNRRSDGSPETQH
ncbi:MAG: bile acid:sodium symporter [Opitutaceae bacterium]|nr:bile acid:sodium symporter [Opitutaceae bacterium]